jgi:hypothetical protein
MKIEALRVAAFRRFAEPAAIEDLARGVNVLAGPNEMGKSTFFHALEAAFTFRHKMTGTELDKMRPFSGGEPLVEADFTIGDTRWRIRKQFGRGNAAILTDLSAGRVVARNAEAEERLNALIGRQGDVAGPIGLVWVRQQKTLHAPDPDIDHISGKEKPRGERSALQEAISREVDTTAVGDVMERVQARIKDALDELLTPTRNAARKNGPLDLARRQREETRAALELAQRARDVSEQRRRQIASASVEIARLSSEDGVQQRTQRRHALEQAVAIEAQRRAEFAIAREALQARAMEAANAKHGVDAARTHAERLRALQQRYSESQKIEADVASLERAIEQNSATPARLERLNAAIQSRAISAAQMGRESAHVAIALDANGAQRVRIDGQPLQQSISRNVSETLDIAIDGIAAIRITAAGAESAAAARNQHEAAERTISEVVSEMQCHDIDEARQRAEERNRAVDNLSRARAKLSGIAGHGSAGIATEIAVLESAVASPAHIDVLLDAQRAADTAAHAARNVHDAIKSQVLGDEAFRKLSIECEESHAAEDAARAAVEALNLRIEKLKSEQAGADEDGRAGQVDTLQGSLERLEREVKRLEAEGKALLLLDRTLATIEARARDTFFVPVTRRLQPYLNEVFGTADLGFRDAFAIDGLTRDGQREAFAVLSDGTREQLSVLVRLAFAELLAARGVSVPLVLDDPLVYSDDERLAKVCRVLEQAAQHMQIIVLTCRATAFQTLSGHRVSVSRWQPEK